MSAASSSLVETSDDDEPAIEPAIERKRRANIRANKEEMQARGIDTSFMSPTAVAERDAAARAKWQAAQSACVSPMPGERSLGSHGTRQRRREEDVARIDEQGAVSNRTRASMDRQFSELPPQPSYTEAEDTVLEAGAQAQEDDLGSQPSEGFDNNPEDDLELDAEEASLEQEEASAHWHAARLAAAQTPLPPPRLTWQQCLGLEVDGDGEGDGEEETEHLEADWTKAVRALHPLP